MPLPPYFNPSNDMALAANVRQYFPPRRIRQMETDLADMARLWDDGPWGWSLAMRQQYLRMGVAEENLPGEAWLGELRRLSSREFAVSYYGNMLHDNQLAQADAEGRLLPCQAHFCYTMPEVEEAMETGTKGTEKAIVKAPWSSSGRGNMVVHDLHEVAAQRRIGHLLREQGGVVVEPFYANKDVDFAMEFWLKGEARNEVEFLGYSVFETDDTGHYGGNYVESQEELKRRIGLPEELLQGLVDHHRRELEQLDYQGPVGIDMMKLKDGTVHPCVEINFRRTMGLLALQLHQKGWTDNKLLAGDPERGFSARIANRQLIITFADIPR